MSDEVKYGVFSWGPCIVQLKISEDFRKKLLSEAEESRKEELKFTTKLAGVIKEEYAYRQKEIFLPELNVRGFYDLVCVSDFDGSVYLIDFKTMANFSWSRKFGWKYTDANPSIHQEIQLATYGLFIEKEFGRLDGMFLYYYNKDTSKMRPVEVPLTMLKRAENFWINVNEEHKKGLPSFKQGVSPVQDWNCRYCRFLDHCKPPFFKKK